MTWEDVTDKFSRLAGNVVGDAGRRAIVEIVADIDTTDAFTLASVLRTALNREKPADY